MRTIVFLQFFVTPHENMITEDNFAKLLQSIGFQRNNNIFEKYFPQTEAYLKVDFDKQELIYPEDKGLKINERQTCNFSANENFVVFECVHRLLEKGYQPKHIELEPKWKVGRGASGGRADILVRNQENKPLLLIECKTAGNEFKKAWKDTLQDGGQLFSYAQQIQETQFLCLYASDFDEKENKVVIEQKIISHKDNIEILQENSKLKSFEKAKNVKERYQVWKETYKLEYTELGIFENNIPAYTIGKEKYELDDLITISESDIQKKYHEFATILRKHNISGRENAFDKLVNLFLAKIVDEKHNKTDLQFRWKGIASDNYFDFIDRLERLYANGMQEFLKEEVTFVEKQNVIDAFKYVRNDPDATRETVLNHFKRQKYFTNSDFSFIDVHNEKLFYQNVVVLREMVQMIENIQLNGDQQNQFLGDLFEGFLDRGVKQSEGQFFTPMPIVKFILSALPLEQIVKNSKKIPKAIDYACGAGHFLTELAAQIKSIVQQYKTETTPKDYYRNIYGIEKEYRLSKVAKVSAFMYGQDEIQIFYNDALVKHPEIRDQSFDILVANPPFAVTGFLETLDEEQRQLFTLSKSVSDLAKNKHIQCFFLERAKQLLKVDGIAAIIVPTSVLSNSDEIHVATREMLLQFFDIIALADFGSGTFGKTGTNTVVLFLRKKDDNPPPHIHFKERVEKWFSDRDEKTQNVYQDQYLIRQYCQHQDFDVNAYFKLLTAFDDLNVIKDLLEYDIFKEYLQEINKKTIPELRTKHKKEKDRLKKQLEKQEPKLDATAIAQELKNIDLEHQKEIDKTIIKYIQNIEKDKLYYFVLAKLNPQKVLIIKSPQDSKEQKKFLGYEWSASKGKEGIKYILENTPAKTEQENENIDEDDKIVYKTQVLRAINTPLFDNNNRQNQDKIAYYIQQNFILEKKYYLNEKRQMVRDYWNEKTEPLTLPEHLKKFVSYVSAENLLDFSRKDFNKAISLTPKKTISIDTKWDLVKLGDVAEIIAGQSPESSNYNEAQNGLPFYQGKKDFGDIFLKNPTVWTTQVTKESLKSDILMSIRAPVGDVNINPFEKICIGRGLAVIRPFEKIRQKYLFEYIQQNKQIFKGNQGMAFDSISKNDLANIKIPLPPLEVQEKIVLECEAIDQATEKAKKEVERLKGEIEGKVKEVLNATEQELKLGQLAETSSGGTPLSSKNEYYQGGTIPWINSGEVGQGEIWQAQNFITELGLKNSSAKMFPKNTVLLAMYGATAGKVGILKIEACTNQAVCGILPNEKYSPKFLYLQLCTMYDYLLSLRTGVARDNLSQSKIQEIKIKLPPLEIQEKLVSEIEILEKQIAENEEIIKNSASQKQAVLKKYL
ncbi:MAG: N-6 DNA methylase [Thermoflexibacter sp.]